ncbi:MAG TPA: MlaD family protein [Polyangiaceae bacterium]|nr:MlaD family protein [Polyangiaceae bacterium]
MNAPARREPQGELPAAEVRRHVGFSWIWLLPLAALGLVGYLLYSLVAERGPTISISFETADGLEAGQTPVKYRAVTLGVVEQIQLTDGFSRVVAKVRMDAQAAPLLTEHARFWVVRPRLTGGLSSLQSGLETLVSGAYVAIDPGPRDGSKRKTAFKGLEKPPSTRSDEPGHVYYLSSKTLGGLGEGSPIRYHEVSAGELLSYELDPNSGEFSLRIFVRAPYDAHVVAGTRFWNDSGLRVDNGAQGLKVEVDSVESLIAGGISFASPTAAAPASPAESHFLLFPSREQAEVGFYGPGLACATYYQSPVNGLDVGSSVTLFGERVGSVTSVEVKRIPSGELGVRVGYLLEPGRAVGDTERGALTSDGLRALVGDRMRVVLQSSSVLLTKKELALEYSPGSAPADVGVEGDTLVLPGEARDLGRLTSTLGDIAAKIDAIPFEALGEHANHALASLDHAVGGPELERTLKSADEALRQVGELARDAKSDLGPALGRLPAISAKLERAADEVQTTFGPAGYGSDSSAQRDLARTLDEVAGAARSVRLFADFLNRHPEALISGRRGDEP